MRSGWGSGIAGLSFVFAGCPASTMEETGAEGTGVTAGVTGSTSVQGSSGTADASSAESTEATAAQTESTGGVEESSGPSLQTSSDAETHVAETGASGDPEIKFDVGTWNDPTVTIPTEGCQKVDFLFVIDASGSMSEEQAALSAAFPGFIGGIEAAGIADYHVAVISASAGSCGGTDGDLGQFRWIPPAGEDDTCAPLAERFITGPSVASTGEFQCIAQVYGSASGYEQPLQASYLALVDRIQDGTNPYEFRRKDALLVIVFITDEDDQSMLLSGTDCTQEPVSVYTHLYEQGVLKGNATSGVFIAISGPETETCSSGLGSAAPAPRIAEFIAHWGAQGFWGNICNGDFVSALAGALATIEVGCERFNPEG